MKRVAVMLASGFEEIEALTVVDILRRGNVDCKMVSLKDKFVTGSHGIKVEADIILHDNIKEFDMIVLPGGMPGSANLRDSKELEKIVVEMNLNEKKIGAICAAPIALEAYGIIKGRNITSYPDALVNKAEVNYKETSVVVDGNIITSRGPATAMEFAYEILRQLDKKEEALSLEKGMLYKN
ncbi:DJ-1 family glyoxalase III [uncultured Clostridium sp.]|uniref:DJ-1 family glyoxalase III n=1 Tax=uncultured Clostridium sp. TaxID=59620 RepID=UPI0026068AAD|nr:DJ-1 family glyoxalase III [uncultured Clostridium sp.]